MIAVMVDPLDILLVLGALAAALIAILTLLEKITGAGQQWLARGVAQGNEALEAKIESLDRKVEATRAEVNDVKADLKEHRQYTRYHLGPNGESPKLHDRVERIERRIDAVSHEQAQVRHDLREDGS